MCRSEDVFLIDAAKVWRFSLISNFFQLFHSELWRQGSYIATDLGKSRKICRLYPQYGEYAVVILCHKAHAPVLEPRVGIAVVEGLEEPLHQAMSTGIDLREVAHGGKGVGAVATTAAGDLHFGQHLPGLLEDGDLHLRTEFFQIDGEEESRGSSTDDSCSHALKTAAARHCMAKKWNYKRGGTSR